MLELRPNCEYCDRDLPPDSLDARICTYECTFCADCVDTVLHNVCPNCGGGFERRPIRPARAHRQGVGLQRLVPGQLLAGAQPSLGHRQPGRHRGHPHQSEEEVAGHSLATRQMLVLTPPQRVRLAASPSLLLSPRATRPMQRLQRQSEEQRRFPVLRA